MPKPTAVAPPTYLGIEGGGTRTTILLAGPEDEILASFEAGPANLRLMHPGELEAHLQGIRKRLPTLPDSIGIGLAGVRLDSDHARLRAAVAKVWPGIPCVTSDDLITALEASEWHPDCDAQVLVLAGTGSCITGRNRREETEKLGGRGHVLGDRGSACDIAQHALRAVMTILDLDNELPPLGSDILTYLQMNEPEDLIDWSMVATKTDLASVAIPVFNAAVTRPDDDIANAVLEKAANRLTTDATACVERLTHPGEQIQFVFNGAVLLKNPSFAKQVASLLQSRFPEAIISPLQRPSVWGAVAQARNNAGSTTRRPTAPTEADGEKQRHPIASSPTEQRNPRTTDFAEIPIAEGIQMMLAEDATIPAAIAAESANIEWAIERVMHAFANGGRLFYTGAGTSGRLGVLDASECPPTFRTKRELVQGLIAGGRQALWSAVEGAEDDPEAGACAIIKRRVNDNDVVIGITASGHAPYVWGSLEEAKSRGATTVLLCCNPAYHGHELPDRVIAPNTGPEVLTGSTRLKAGTATKLVLNLITTLALTHSGKVIGNLMIDLNPSNIKLRDRAVRIVSELTRATPAEANQALENSSWNVREAYESLS
ncbi:MAG: N-acetylmuramic acid 6-phosphate etherase [Verrucomicrobiales bacterium]